MRLLAGIEAIGSRAAKILFICVASIIALIIALLAASLFTNGLIRGHAEQAMNQKLVGYHTTVGHARLNLLTGNLTLTNVVVIQNAHPTPPVMNIDSITAHIDWAALFTGRIVAAFKIRRPQLHIDLLQLEQESSNKTPVSKEGWQDAIQNIYPFKINRFLVEDGDLTYVDVNPKQPLHLQHLYVSAGNIRNIYAPRKTYPSTLHASAVLFGQSQLTVDGYANFLAKPFPGVWIRYWLQHLPLEPFDPVISHANLTVHGGRLESTGILQYAPWIEQAEVYDAKVEGINLQYVHLPQTTGKEEKHAKEAKQTAKQVNNKPGLILKVDKAEIVNSRVAYTDKGGNPPYTLFFSNLDVTTTNFSNHFYAGTSKIRLTGKFMGSGDTVVKADFRPEQAGPDFTLNTAIRNTDVTSLNDLFRNYGKFDVADGMFSLFTQMSVKEGEVHGYVKPLFSNVKVYSYQKEKNKSVVKQAYELVVGAASHLFRNHATQKVATEVDISGKLSQPNVSTWQALAELIRNAFIKAILPGFEHQAQGTSSNPAAKPG
ncbi:MAG TPA: DUF748 domain-containing protein [Candidatus Binataceae bacterium]|nr:DUF748 domain-containing protein [Candidatus Binataceae bacterium]